MSLPFDGFKAAQTGLVDMGNISFYNNAGLQFVRAGAGRAGAWRSRWSSTIIRRCDSCSCGPRASCALKRIHMRG
jgi:hypothetical protein